MSQQPLEAGRQATLRQSLRKRISLLVTAGAVLLALLVVSAVVGLILAAANDVAGVAAVRAIAGVFAVTSGLVLLAILATLSHAVLLILDEGGLPENRSEPQPDQNQTSESPRMDAG